MQIRKRLVVGLRSGDELALKNVDVEEGQPDDLREHQNYEEKVQET